MEDESLENLETASIAGASAGVIAVLIIAVAVVFYRIQR
jgi:hypothetical protein